MRRVRALLIRYLWDSKVGVLTFSLLLGTVLTLPAWFHLLDWGHRTVAVAEMRPDDFTWAASRRVTVNARPVVEGDFESALRTRGGRDRWLCVPLRPSEGLERAGGESIWALIPMPEELSPEEAAEGLREQRRFEGVLRNVLWEQRESGELLAEPGTFGSSSDVLVLQVGRNPQTDVASLLGTYLFWGGAGVLVLWLRRRARKSAPTT